MRQTLLVSTASPLAGAARPCLGSDAGAPRDCLLVSALAGLALAVAAVYRRPVSATGIASRKPRLLPAIRARARLELIARPFKSVHSLELRLASWGIPLPAAIGDPATHA